MVTMLETPSPVTPLGQNSDLRNSKQQALGQFRLVEKEDRGEHS